MNITPEAIVLLPKLRLLLEAKVVTRQVLADAGSTSPPYLERIPAPKWAALLEVVTFSYRGRPIFTRDWTGLPKGALAGAIQWNLPEEIEIHITYDEGRLHTTCDLIFITEPVGMSATVDGFDPDLAVMRVVLAWVESKP